MSPTTLPARAESEITERTRFSWPVVVALLGAVFLAGGAVASARTTAGNLERHEAVDEKRWMELKQELRDDLKAIRSDVSKTREDVATLRGRQRALAREE
jgi:hypothetical protein